MKKYYTQDSYKTIAFVEATENGNNVDVIYLASKIELGKIENYKKEEAINIDTFAKALTDYLYKEISEKEFLELQKNAEAILLERAQEKSTEKYKITSWEEIKKIYNPPFQNKIEHYLKNKNYQNFCLYKGNTIIENDLEINFDSLGINTQTAQRSIIVDGNLIINGNLNASHNVTNLPQYLYVTGNLKAKNIITSGWLEIIVKGNVEVENIILGYDGESGGSFTVHGTTQSQYILNGSMYLFDFQQKVSAQCYVLDDEDDVRNFTSKTIPSMIKASEWETAKEHLPLKEETFYYDEFSKEYCFNFDIAVQILKKEKSIFKNK